MQFWLGVIALIVVVVVCFAIAGGMVIQEMHRGQWENHCARLHTVDTPEYQACLDSYPY
jgi:hypothetical protein